MRFLPHFEKRKTPSNWPVGSCSDKDPGLEPLPVKKNQKEVQWIAAQFEELRVAKARTEWYIA
jgi:hypothetical protein